MGYGYSADYLLGYRDKITQNERHSAFNSYWSFYDQSMKWQCIYNWIKTENVKNFNDEVEDEERSRKQRTLRIYETGILIFLILPDEKGNLLRVCQTMFLETLGK